MFTLYWIAAFALTRKPNRIGPLFTYENGDFGSIFCNGAKLPRRSDL